MFTDSIAPRHAHQAAALLAGILRDLEDRTRRTGDDSGAVVGAIYRSETAKVRSFQYFDSEPGRSTTSAGRGPSAQGTITVGDAYLKGTDAENFARRVLRFRCVSYKCY
jgi:hypothetical protein